VQWFAAREAVAYLEHALELTGRLSDADIRKRHELDVRSALSSALGSLHGYASDTARRNYERVCKLCEEIGTPADLYVALYALWPSQAARAEHGCADTAERLVRLARDGGNAESCAQADVVLGRTLWWQGRFREACDVLEPVAGFWERNGTITRGSVFELEPPEIAASVYLGAASWFLGHVERARECIREAVSIAERVAQPFVLAGTFLDAAYVSHLLRDHDETEKLARRTIVLSEEHEFPFWNALAVALLGWAHVERGDPQRGAELIREGLALQHATGTRTVSSHMLAFLAAASLRYGDLAAGMDAIEEGLALAASSCDKVYEPELWRLKGELLAAAASKKRKGKRASPDTASTEGDDCFYRALEIARANDAKSLELRAAVSLARLRAAQARPAEGRTVLAPVCEWFADGVDTPDLREARALLTELRSRR
jgi:tetratricopeptide (TPR) repeat protein